MAYAEFWRLRMTYSEPVVPCTGCKGGWKHPGNRFCAECYEGQIELLRNALDNSQSLLVAMLIDRPPTEDLEAQIAENRETLSPGFFDEPARETNVS